MYKKLIFIPLILTLSIAEIKGQVAVSPAISIKVTDTAFVDTASGSIQNIPLAQSRITNYNPSVYVADSTPYFIYDSLRTGGTATIVTVYETDEDSIVGLWQIGSGGNRALWLNSQRVSYEDFAITYRTSTERGVVIHTMHYNYPETDSNYDGQDTLFLGREGDNLGDKNLCALLYYPGHISNTYQRQLESSLAVRYGALLHGAYIDHHGDTLWNPLGDDSLYSFGVCGIGRDDSLSVFQPKSIIRNGILAIEAVDTLVDLDYVMLGCDSNNVFDLADDFVIVDTIPCLAVARQWKLRAHTSNDTIHVRLTPDLSLPAGVLHLMLTTDDDTIILPPDTANTFTFTLAEGQDYYITLLIEAAALTTGSKGVTGNNHSDEYSDGSEPSTFIAPNATFTISPNPTAGHFTAIVNQPDEDIINIRVVDAHGRIVDQSTTTEKHSQYQYKGLLKTDGIYYVTITSNGQQKTIKLIVVK
ncbi:MAG: T9SS type A sorting domain-containing protein [Bacteroidales bacterium]|nr:T9SS type A sorting domain-containing protein [Bacteroidales bacterium]